jgi:hypothetical protein
MGSIFRRLLGAGVFPALLLSVPVQAEDPLDDLDGTEGWDQVVQPRKENTRDMQAEQDAFRREVADWESIRQLWQEQREGYIMERTAHQRQYKRLKADRRRRRRPPKADITEETLSRPQGEGDWGDEPGEAWFEDSSPNIDKAIDAELGETGAVPGTRSKTPARTRPAPVPIPAPHSQEGGVPDAFKQRKRAPDPEAEAAQEEIRRMREAEERKRREKEERRRLEEEQRSRLKKERNRRDAERRKREEEARRKKEEEAAAGAAAAEALLKQQEQDLRKEQEAIRKKAKLKLDEEGQVVDPELKKEIEEEEEEEEED